MDLLNSLKELETGMTSLLAEANSAEKLEDLRVEILGRKGRLAQIMSQLPKISPAERAAVGKLANEVKERLGNQFAQRKEALEAEREAAFLSSFDASMPGRSFWRGSLHPVSQVMNEICTVFQKLGFDIADGPEVEIDRYNFEALNIPPDHPARDMHDTLYITENILLRTHTSPVQVRTMLAQKPPVAIIAPGKVYRRDSDLTHTPMFHQIEGLLVDHGVSMANLRGVLLAFVRAIFGPNTSLRFRPSFFPFTEPSAEVDISCMICHGKGHNGNEPCRVCKTTGWVEILGSGMVDPNVYEAVGYGRDVSGFAFGMGVERIAMLKYGITDLRMFFQNDIRFLSQFGVEA